MASGRMYKLVWGTKAERGSKQCTAHNGAQEKLYNTTDCITLYLGRVLLFRQLFTAVIHNCVTKS